MAQSEHFIRLYLSELAAIYEHDSCFDIVVIFVAENELVFVYFLCVEQLSRQKII